MKKSIFFILIGLLFTTVTNATTLWVSTTGASSGSTQPYTLTYAYSLATNGDILLLDAGTYTDVIAFPTTNSITIKGNPNAGSMPVLNFALGAPTGTNGTLIFDGVKIDRGDKASAVFFTPGQVTTTNKGWSIKFQNCQISNIRSLIDIGTQGADAINEISIDNCILSDIGNSNAYCVMYLYLPVNAITIKNSTFRNINSSDFIANKTSAASSTIAVKVYNNTFYNALNNGKAIWSDTNSGSGYATGSTFDYVNNILDKTNSLGRVYTVYLRKGTGVLSEYNLTYIAPTWNTSASDNYYWGQYRTVGSETVANGNSFSTLFGTTTPYTDAATGNFYLGSSSPAATGGYNTALNGITYTNKIGDPRWLQTPAITPSSSTITGIDYNLNTSTATVQSFTLNVALPGSQITLTAPTDYEISTSSSSGFGSSLSLGTQWFNLSTTIYVRMKSGLSAGTYNNENISITTTGITTQNVSCSGTATSMASLDAPTGISASSVSYTSFLASWSSVTNASSYQVKVYDGASLVSTASGITGTSSTITGLSQNTAYTFKVIAVGDGVSYSNSSESAASDPFTTLTLTLTTSVNTPGAGTVSKSADVPYTVEQSVNLTAMRSFGYQFEKWVDAANGDADLSTDNPYAVTLNVSQNIKAVFSAIATYNFSVSKAGTGANWGSVTVSPAPNGGKEETGTSVTMTPLSNIVSTFSQWDDASTGAKTVTVSGDATYTATFNANPFLVAWDFPTTSVVKDRTADYYYNSSNQGVIRLLKVDGVSENWTFNTLSGENGMKRWTSKADLQANTCRSFQVELSAKGYKNIQVNSKVLYRNNMVNKIQKIQYSSDGTTFHDVNTIDLSVHTNDTWLDFNGSLPASADNANTLFIRWTGDVNSGVIDINAGTTEEFHLTSILVSGTPITTSATSGDFVATVSGDINTASNLSVAGDSGWGITGTAVSTPTSSDNIWIPTNVEMSTSSSVNCKDLNINGKFTASNTVTIAGDLNIKSDVNGTGTILGNSNLNITGTTNIQQYLPTGRNWYVGIPVTDASNVPYTALTSAGASSVSYWDEANGVWVNNYTGNLVRGRGYIAVSSAGSATNNISFSGTLNTGDVTVELTRTAGKTKEGFNLIANPYPSYLNAMTSINVDTTKVYPTIWYRTKSGAYSFETVNSNSGVGTNGVTGYIPPMQAFWIRVKPNADPLLNNSATLTFTNAMRSHANPSGVTTTVLKAPKLVQDKMLRLTVSNGINTDETVIYTNANASNGYDIYDSNKMSNVNVAIPELYTVLGSENMVINGYNQFPENVEISLGFKTGQANSFTIKAKEMTNFDEGTTMMLKDKLTDMEYELTEGDEVVFSSEAENTTNRFSLILRVNGAVTGTEYSTEINNDWSVFVNKNAQLVISSVKSGSEVSVYNTTGQKISERKVFSQPEVLQENYCTGIYMVKVNNQVKKVIVK